MNFLTVPLFLFSLLIAQFSCQNDKTQKQTTSMKQYISEIPDQIATNIQVDFIDTSFLKARLWAKSAEVFFNRKETILRDSIRVEFYSKKDKKRISVLSSDSARIDDARKDMYAFGRVIVVSDSPKTILKTTYLQWKNNVQKIYSNEFIEVIRPDEEIRGYGFESDLSLTNYRIFNVSGVKK